MRRLFSMLLPLVLLLSLAACGEEPKDLMETVRPEKPAALAAEELPEHRDGVTGFGVRLLQESAAEGENLLLSPISVLSALAMTANGAEGETLRQMEAVLGMSVGELNAFLHDYLENLPENKRNKLSMANSIWFTDDENFAVKEDFLQTVSAHYDAGIYQVSFDESALKEINGWVNEHTDGMIPTMLDRMDPDAVMYLINALAFDAEWEEPYNEHQVREGVFTTENGREQTVELLRCSVHTYLEDEHATGFLKYYKDGKYAFAALLPNEGISMADYVDSLTGESLHGLLTNPKSERVVTAVPKFETGSFLQLKEILEAMGMADAFDAEKADFSGLGSYQGENVLISRVLHKTFLAVDENGTKAGAATVVEMKGGSAAPSAPPKEVILDRPFVYLLIDCENSVPLFIGTLMEVDET